MIPPPPASTLFPYTTLFRSLPFFQMKRINVYRSIFSTILLLLFLSYAIGSGNRILDALTSIKAAVIKGEAPVADFSFRSEEHTSELQSRENLVCRLLLEKKT